MVTTRNLFEFQDNLQTAQDINVKSVMITV